MQDTQQFIKAIEKGSLKQVFDFIRAGADVNAKGEFNRPAVICALQSGNKKAAQLLIVRGADVNATNSYGCTPLMYATEYPLVVDLLIHRGADVNKPNNDGETPLMVAVNTGRMKSVRLLLNAKANPNAVNEDGKTPLMFSAEKEEPDDFLWDSKYRETDIIDALLESGADINAKDKDGNTALLLAAQNQKVPDIIDYLIEKGAQNIANNDGVTPFMALEKRGFESSMVKMIEAGLMPEISKKSKKKKVTHHKNTTRKTKSTGREMTA